MKRGMALRSEKQRLRPKITEKILETVLCRYHFPKKEKETMKQVAAALEETVRRQAGFWWDVRENTEAASVAVTLGDGVDRLQEEYTKQGRLLECYMAETLADELLLSLYPKVNARITQKTGRRVARCRFYGSDAFYPLEEMKKAPVLCGLREVVCNEAGCLLPKKSVVFWAELTGKEGTVCEKICAGCGQKGCLWRRENPT